jgi:urea transport system permease protein
MLLGSWLTAIPCHAGATPTATADSDFQTAVDALKTRDFKAKERAVEAIAATGHPRSAEVLNTLLDGRLYYRKKDKRVVITVKEGRQLQATDAITGEALGSGKKRAFKRITVNNRLRKAIRSVLARRALADPNPGRRLAAVEELARSPSSATSALLREPLVTAQDPAIRRVLDYSLALVDLKADDPATRLAAIDTLGERLEPEARAALTAIADDPGADATLRSAAAAALENLEFRLKLYSWIETAFFGLGLGAVLALAAIGLAITFGVMGVINMAHGELIMIGAYTTYVIQQWLPNLIDWSLFIAIPAAFIVSGLVGILIERGVIRFLYGRPLETLLATFGVSLILQQAVRSVFSPLNRSVETPSWMAGSLEINSALSLTLNRVYILGFTIAVFIALLLVLRRTRLGLEVRAVAQNRAMARAMGVRSARVDALTFGLGSGIAGVAGVALSQLTNVGPNLGQSYIVESFMVVVFGGVGSLWGTLTAGLSLGIAEKFMEPWSGAVLAKILVLIAIILFIQKRPRGLFPQKGRAAEG